MAVEAAPTPNPNAVKLVVGRPVGGPATVTPSTADAPPWADELVGVEGVTSVFFTADFVTVTKSPSAAWDDILPEATSILERELGD